MKETAMHPHLAHLTVCCSVMLGALVLSACGGGAGGADTPFNVSTGATTATSAAISNGKNLYGQYCAQCHGASMPAAKDSSRLLSAIASNRGGMGSLRSVVSTSQADDIAGYLAFGI